MDQPFHPSKTLYDRKFLFSSSELLALDGINLKSYKTKRNKISGQPELPEPLKNRTQDICMRILYKPATGTVWISNKFEQKNQYFFSKNNQKLMLAPNYSSVINSVSMDADLNCSVDGTQHHLPRQGSIVDLVVTAAANDVEP